MPPRHRRNDSTVSNGSFNGGGERSMRASSSFMSGSASFAANNTSVNIATAFAQSQSSRAYPSKTSRLVSRSPQPPSLSLPVPPVMNSTRMLSPAAEKVAHSAQANGPVSYYLTAREADALNGTRSVRSHHSGSEVSADEDSYGAEDAYVEQQRNATAGPSRNQPRRGGNAKYDDDAWRPEHADSDGDSGAGDEHNHKTRPVLHRDARPKRATSVASAYGGDLGVKSRQHRDTSVRLSDAGTPVINMSRGDGTPQQIIPVIPEEPGSPTAINRGPTPARTAARRTAENVAGLLLVDDYWHKLKRNARKLRQYLRPHLRTLMGTVLLALLAIMLRSFVIGNLFGKSAPYHAPTQAPSSMGDLADRLVAMEGHFQGLTKKLSMERQETIVDLRDLRDTVGKLKVDLNNVAASNDNYGSAIRNLESDMASVKLRINAVERDIQSALDDGRIKSALERILPRHLPVRYEKGNLVVDPHVYAEFKKLFVGSGEVEETVRKMIAGGVQTPKDQWSVNKYERELEAWVDRMFERWTKDSKYIERSEFIDLLHYELANVKKDVKVSPGMLNNSPVTIKTAKGEDVTAALQALIDAALVKYSKDTLAMPDYALFSAGARVIPYTTSPTLVLSKASIFDRWMKGHKDTEGRQPATALYPDNAVGNCWPFAGDKGSLGILLARRVKVTAITVEHAAVDVSFDMATAPRRMEVWMTVESAEDQAKAKEYLDRRARMDTEPRVPSLSLEETPERLLLTVFDYDATSGTPIQTFPVPSDLTELGIEASVVVFRIESNWGGDFTCLYRVRVHGEEIPPEVNNTEPLPVEEGQE